MKPIPSSPSSLHLGLLHTTESPYHLPWMHLQHPTRTPPLGRISSPPRLPLSTVSILCGVSPSPATAGAFHYPPRAAALSRPCRASSPPPPRAVVDGHHSWSWAPLFLYIFMCMLYIHVHVCLGVRAWVCLGVSPSLPFSFSLLIWMCEHMCMLVCERVDVLCCVREFMCACVGIHVCCSCIWTRLYDPNK